MMDNIVSFGNSEYNVNLQCVETNNEIHVLYSCNRNLPDHAILRGTYTEARDYSVVSHAQAINGLYNQPNFVKFIEGYNE